MRTDIARVISSKRALGAVITAVTLAVVGTTLGYSMLGTKVTLNVDGEARTVTTFGTTVGDLLQSQGLELTARDVVAPGLDEAIEPGSRVTVRFARELELVVDGEAQTHWVTALDVDTALNEIGRRYGRAALSASRSAAIGRDGLSLEVKTPKTFVVTVGAGEAEEHVLPALTVADVLDELDIELGRRDEVVPALDEALPEGGEVAVNRIRVVTRDISDEVVKFGTVTERDDSRFTDEKTVLKSGETGLRNVTYRLRIVNGEIVRRVELASEITKEAVDQVVSVGTKSRPAPSYSGNTVWDRLAQCESGGRWNINTGNGYYGGLQFSLSTWRAVGGTGYPHQHSRAEQIKRGQILQARAGWGQWPACSRKLGLR